MERQQSFGYLLRVSTSLADSSPLQRLSTWASFLPRSSPPVPIVGCRYFRKSEKFTPSALHIDTTHEYRGDAGAWNTGYTVTHVRFVLSFASSHHLLEACHASPPRITCMFNQCNKSVALAQVAGFSFFHKTEFAEPFEALFPFWEWVSLLTKTTNIPLFFCHANSLCRIDL